MENSFIGPRQIKTVTVDEMRTPEGKEVVKVVFEGDHTEFYPRVMFDKMVTAEPSDFSELAKLRKKIVTGQIMGILKENDVQLQELNDIFKFVGFQSDIHFDKASNYLWTNNDDEFVAGMAVLARRTFLDAQRIIDTIPVKEKSDATTEADGGTTESALPVPEGEASANGEAASPTGDAPSEGTGTPAPDA